MTESKRELTLEDWDRYRTAICEVCHKILSRLDDDIACLNVTVHCEGVGGYGEVKHRCLSHYPIKDREYLYKGSKDDLYCRSKIDV